MKLFQHFSGAIIAFGFDMTRREPNGSMICWSDIDGKTWEAKATNCAGWNIFHPGVVQSIDPEFVFEIDAKVVAYQPGLCIQMTFIGAPLVWAFSFMRPDRSGVRLAA